MSIETRTIPETVIEGKRLGRHVRHDPESKRYAEPEPASLTLTHVDWTDTVLLDQGNVGSCTGNATVGNLGTGEFIGTEPAGTALTETLALGIYSDAEVIDGNGPYPPNDNGSSGLSVAKAAKTRGLISGYTHALSLTAALAALQRQPVITGVNWYTGFDTPDADGFAQVSGTVRGGHEFVVVGNGTAADFGITAVPAATRLVKARNSWGPSFGVNGYFYFTEADWGRLLSEQGDVTIFTPLTQPAPTPTPTPTPGPGATFPVSALVAAHIHASALRAKLTDDAWLEHHLRIYFHLAP